MGFRKGERGGRNRTEILRHATNQPVTAAECSGMKPDITKKVGEFFCPPMSLLHWYKLIMQIIQERNNPFCIAGANEWFVQHQIFTGQCCIHCNVCSSLSWDIHSCSPTSSLIYVSKPNNSEAILFCLLLKQDPWIGFHLKSQLVAFRMIKILDVFFLFLFFFS